MATYYEAFTGQDWDRASQNVGKIAAAGCIVISIAAMVFGVSVLIGLWTLFAGLLISIWEVPLLYVLIPKCEEARTALVDRAYFKLPLVRAALYIVLSILCYARNTLCIAAGILLDVSALLYIFAAINRHDDQISGLTTDDDVSETGGNNGLLASNKFGTF